MIVKIISVFFLDFDCIYHSRIKHSHALSAFLHPRLLRRGANHNLHLNEGTLSPCDNRHSDEHGQHIPLHRGSGLSNGYGISDGFGWQSWRSLSCRGLRDSLQVLFHRCHDFIGLLFHHERDLSGCLHPLNSNPRKLI